MIELLVIGLGFALLVGSLARALRPARKVEYQYMTVEQASALCCPSRANLLTGVNFNLGSAGMGGYFDDPTGQVPQVENYGHAQYWQGRPLPQEVPDLGVMPVRTGNSDAGRNNTQPSKWEQLNANEWAQVDRSEYEPARQ